jgi:hypothetical protein
MKRASSVQDWALDGFFGSDPLKENVWGLRFDDIDESFAVVDRLQSRVLRASCKRISAIATRIAVMLWDRDKICFVNTTK